MSRIVPKKITATGVVVNAPCRLTGVLLSHDGSNDPTITIYDDTTNTAGNEIYSGTWTDTTGPIGWMKEKGDYMSRGIYVTIANLGTGFFTFFVE